MCAQLSKRVFWRLLKNLRPRSVFKIMRRVQEMQFVKTTTSLACASRFRKSLLPNRLLRTSSLAAATVDGSTVHLYVLLSHALCDTELFWSPESTCSAGF